MTIIWTLFLLLHKYLLAISSYNSQWIHNLIFRKSGKYRVQSMIVRDPLWGSMEQPKIPNTAVASMPVVFEFIKNQNSRIKFNSLKMQ